MARAKCGSNIAMLIAVSLMSRSSALSNARACSHRLATRVDVRQALHQYHIKVSGGVRSATVDAATWARGPLPRHAGAARYNRAGECANWRELVGARAQIADRLRRRRERRRAALYRHCHDAVLIDVLELRRFVPLHAVARLHVEHLDAVRIAVVLAAAHRVALGAAGSVCAAWCRGRPSTSNIPRYLAMRSG